MKKIIYLIDTENVGSSWRPLLKDCKSQDRLLFFFTENSPGMPYVDLEQLLKSKIKYQFISCHTGKNGLDFQLVSYLGYLLKSWSKSNKKIIIISNDTGYDPVVQFWSERGFHVDRISPSPVISSNKSKQHRVKSSAKVSLPKSSISEPSPNSSTKQTVKRIHTKTLNSLPTAAPEEPISDNSETLPASETEITASHSESFFHLIDQFLPDSSKSDRIRIVTILKSFSYRQKQEIHYALVKEFGEASGAAYYRRLRPHLFELYQSSKS